MSGKIIIKPPRQAPSSTSSSAQPAPTVTIPAPGTFSRVIAPPPPPLSDHGDAEDVIGEAGDDGDSQAMDVDSPTTAVGDEEGSAIGTPRPRGRPPKARGGTSTPRGRGSGRGKSKGKGRGSLLIRLPKRGEEDIEAGAEDDVDGQGAGEGEADSGEAAKTGDAEQEEEPKEKEKEKEEPLGGGKPFRKINGKVYIIEGDEYVTEDDAKGDEKIDRSGVLLGGRKFKAGTFILPNRHPTRHYMLAIDAARTSGFRDSLYYFRRNPLAFKLNATQPEKDFLISEGKLGSHLRTRSVTLITARSAFKLHGSKMVIDGKWVVDDYHEQKVLEEITAQGLKPGDPVGELPDPNASSQAHLNELSALAAGSGSGQGKGDRSSGGIYRAGGPTTLFGGSGWGPFSDGPLNAVRKSVLSRDGVMEENWMWMMATRVNEAGEEWAKWRKEGLLAGGGAGAEELIPLAPIVEKALPTKEAEEVEVNEEVAQTPTVAMDVDTVSRKAGKRKKAGKNSKALPLGAYEPHSGLVFYRVDTQPTRCRWDVVPESTRTRHVLGGTKVGNGAWALAWVNTVMETGFARDEEEKEREALLKISSQDIHVVQDTTT